VAAVSESWLSEFSEKLQQELVTFARSPRVLRSQIGSLCLNHSLMMMSSFSPLSDLSKTQRFHILSENAEKLSVFRKVMLSASLPASLYDQLHPPGWCLVPGLEERHRDTWAGLRNRIVEADTRARTLLQILLIIQTGSDNKPEQGSSYTDRQKIERLQNHWNTEALAYCRKTLGEDDLNLEKC